MLWYHGQHVSDVSVVCMVLEDVHDGADVPAALFLITPRLETCIVLKRNALDGGGGVPKHTITILRFFKLF